MSVADMACHIPHIYRDQWRDAHRHSSRSTGFFERRKYHVKTRCYLKDTHNLDRRNCSYDGGLCGVRCMPRQYMCIQTDVTHEFPDFVSIPKRFVVHILLRC